MPVHRRIVRLGFWLVAVIGLALMPTARAQDAFDSAARRGGDKSDGKGTTTRPAETKKAAEKETKAEEKKPEPRFVRKTLREWQMTLPRGVFEVTRLKATEPPFSGKYAVGHFKGTFVCACCDAPLFSSRAKFNSGTGWPSFWQPIKRSAIGTAADYSDGQPRIEVMCRRCGAHLGHVFDDAPATPTGLRFCINSLSLKLEASHEKTTRSASSKTKGRPRSRAARVRARARARAKAAREAAESKTEKADETEKSSDDTEAPASSDKKNRDGQ